MWRKFIWPKDGERSPSPEETETQLGKIRGWNRQQAEALLAKWDLKHVVENNMSPRPEKLLGPDVVNGGLGSERAVP